MMSPANDEENDKSNASPGDTSSDRDDVSLSSSHGAESKDHSERSTKDEVKALAAEETKQIWIWKFIVILLIILTAAIVSTGAYIFLHRDEDEGFSISVSEAVGNVVLPHAFPCHSKETFFPTKTV